MDEIIIDTSAVIAVLINEPLKQKMVEITQGALLAAPASLPWEVGNAFSAMFKRKAIDWEQAQKAIETFSRLSLRPISVDVAQSVRLAYEQKLYAYDAYFLSACLSLGAPLLTLDQRLSEAAGRVGVKSMEVH